MLILLIHNDGTGTEQVANYNVEVRVNQEVIKTLRIEGHWRRTGWRQLIKRIYEETEDSK